MASVAARGAHRCGCAAASAPAAARAAAGPARAPPAAATAAAAAAAGRRPSSGALVVCRFVSDRSRSRSPGSPAPPHHTSHPATTTLEEALARLSEARLAASEAVERLARLASDPDEAVAELVSRLASSPRPLGGADVRQRRRSRRAAASRQKSLSPSRMPWALPPIVVVEAPTAQQPQQQPPQQPQK